MTVGGNQSGSPSRESEFEQRVVLDTRPCYVRYSLRGLGVFSGGLCLVFAILNVIFHLNFVCILFSAIQGVLGFFVITNEAAGGSVRICHCIFLNQYPKCSGWIERQPLWVKPIGYMLIPLPGMIFCTTWYTFFGGGMVLFTGVAYAISLWRNPTSNEDSNNASSNENRNSPSTINISSPVSNSSPNEPMFPKHTNINNNNNTRNPAASSTVTSQPSRPTIIDIRQHNNATTQQQQQSKSPGGGKASPLNPLASLSNYDANSKGNNYYDGGESGGNDRYENISVISGQTRNTNTATTALEMNPHHSPNSYYGNVVDLDNDDEDTVGGGYGGAFPDNPFVVQTNPNRNVERIRHPRRGNYDDEANC